MYHHYHVIVVDKRVYADLSIKMFICQHCRSKPTTIEAIIYLKTEPKKPKPSFSQLKPTETKPENKRHRPN